MRHLKNFLDGLRTSALSPLMAFVLAFAFVFGMVVPDAYGWDEWQIQTVDSGGGVRISLAFDPQGSPGISYYDATNEDLKYAYWNGTAWEIEIVDSEGKVGWPTSLAFDPLGNPAIVYYDYDNYYLKYAHWNGTSWDIDVVDNVGDTGGWGNYCYRISLVYDSSGNPAIAYYNGGSYWDLKYAHFNGTSWDIQTVYDDGWRGGWTRNASLDFNPSGNPGIAFREQYIGLRYAYWNGISWDIETVDSGYGTGVMASLRFDHLGNPAIAYDWRGVYEGPHELRYAYFNGTSWNIETLESGSSSPSLAFDLSENPAISYRPWPNRGLKYAHWNGASWDIEIVDSTGAHSSLAFNAQGNPAIGYAGGGDLKFAIKGLLIGAPDISLSATAHNFGDVQVGSSSAETLVVSNVGNADLEVSGISSSDAQFSIYPTAFTVAASGSQNVTVTFAPTSSGNKSATLTLASNDPDSPQVSVSLSGRGVQLGVAVSVPDTSAAPGESFSLPVYIGDTTGKGIIYAKIVVTYDPNILTATNANIEGTITQSAGWGAPTYNTLTGQIKIALAGAYPLSGSGKLLNIEFTVSPSASSGQTSPLTLVEMIFNEGTPQADPINSGTFTVSQVEPGEPQIVVLLSASTDQIEVGKTLEITQQTQNIGDGPAYDVTIRVEGYADLFETVSYSSSWGPQDLAPGEAIEGHLSLRAAKEGLCTIWAKAWYKDEQGTERASEKGTVDVRVIATGREYTFQTTESLVQLKIDGIWYNSPWSFKWQDNSSHTVEVPAIQAISADSRYRFDGWMGKSTSRDTLISIQASAEAAGTYHANYKKQYTLEVATEPSDLLPFPSQDPSPDDPPDWYDEGRSIVLTAADTADGYQFSHWQVDDSVLGGNPIIVVMSRAHRAAAFYKQVNQRPNAPTAPSGPDTGYVDSTYSFSTSTTDPDGDSLAYRFDWGDGNILEWTDFVASGRSVELSHSFPESGIYQIKAQAKDEYEAESDWSEAHYIIIESTVIPPESAATVTVDPTDTLVSHPSSFTVNIIIKNVEDMGSFQFDLAFDPSKLQVDSIDLGDFLGSTGNTASPVGPTIDSENGIATFGAFSFGPNPGPTGSGILARISLSTKDIADATDLDLENVQVTDKEGDLLPVEVIDGKVTIVSRYPYDIDDDGDVDIVDIQLVAARWNTKKGDAKYDPFCDIDGDRDIDVVDIQRVAAHWGEKAPFAKFLALVLQNDITISIVPAEVEAEGQVELSVLIEGVEDLGAFEFEIGYLSEIVQVRDVRLGDFLGSTGNTASATGPEIDNVNGRVIFGGFSFGPNPGPSGTGVLALITFDIVGNGPSPLEFLSVQITDKEGTLLAVSETRSGLITEVEQELIQSITSQFSLSQNSPNPFNSGTTIRYQLAERGPVYLRVFNMAGSLIRTLIADEIPAGFYSVRWDGTDDEGQPLASGIYFYQLKAGDFVQTKKMLLLR